VYPVTLTVVDRAGNDDMATFDVTVKDTIDPVPVSLKDREAKLEERLSFDASQSTDNVGIVNFTWVVEKPSGGVVELYGPRVDYVPDEPGDHEVTLIVSDADGNAVTADPFTVHVPNLMLWLTLMAIIVGSIAATVTVALYTKRKTRRMDKGRSGSR
jgi:hypothetical protein